MGVEGTGTAFVLAGGVPHRLQLQSIFREEKAFMFSFFNRSRRHVAVLAALAMLASVLVAAPAVAADDPPEPDFTATFTACDVDEMSGYTDVPSGHSNTGDIDCIAYYGITQGTSATTYSPLMAVTREHMALFLTRLAARVDIEMASDPDNPFTDTSDLSAKSQTAIAQLADLGITQGTSATTFSPGDNVRRDHMALFISRLMNLMNPATDGDDEDGDWGYTPSDVVDNDQDKDIGSPYTDLGPTTKSAYDAITQLYELGVASGISDTAYAPSALITRAAMAEFMAGVMGHSNLRPAGASIQAAKTSGFGDITTTVIISVRDDSFAAVEDRPVDHFNSAADDGGLDEGACSDVDDAVNGDCEWTEDDDFTNGDGNLVLPGESTTEGYTRVYYAWIGDEDGDKFDADDVDYDSVSITASRDEEALKATSTINEEAATNLGNRVDLDKVSTVTITVQLVDTSQAADGDTPAGPGADAKAVARSGQDITVEVSETVDPDADGDADGATPAFSSSKVATLTTDDDGKVTYTVEGPDDDNDNNDVNYGDVIDATANPPTRVQVDGISGLEDRIDTITFNYVTTADVNDGNPAVAMVTYIIRWSEVNPMTTKVEATANDYVIVEADGDARVSATVTFYDQYGNGYRQGTGQKVGIEFGTGEMRTVDGVLGPYDPVANVGGNGVARRSKTLEGQSAGTPIDVVYTEDAPDTDDAVNLPTDVEDDLDADDVPDIQVVTEADTDDTDAGPKNVHTLYADDNQFTTESGTPANADTLYSYDSDDTFIMGGEAITMDEFEKALANMEGDDGGHVNAAVVNVVIYNPDGLSIFEVTHDSEPDA